MSADGLDWRARALCADTDPEDWHLTGADNPHGQARRLLQMCSRCPVLDACEAMVLNVEERARRSGATRPWLSMVIGGRWYGQKGQLLKLRGDDVPVDYGPMLTCPRCGVVAVRSYGSGRLHCARRAGGCGTRIRRGELQGA